MSAHGAPWRGPALVTAVEGLSLLVGFVAQLLLMRALGPASYGGYVLACAVGVLVATATDFGFNYAGVQRAVELRDDESARHRHFWAVQACKAVLGALATLLVVLLAPPLAGPHAGNVLLASALAALAALCFPAWYLLARQQALRMALSLLLARGLCCLAMAWLVRAPEQVALAVALTVAAPLLAAPGALLQADLRRRLRHPLFDVAALRRSFLLGATTFWAASLPGLAAAVVQALVLACGSATVLGLYAAADKVRAALQGLFLAFGTAAFPASVRHFTDDRRQGWHQGLRLLRLQLAVAVAVALPLALWPHEIVRLVSGPAFADAAPVLRLLALAVVTSTLVATLGVQLLIPLGRAGLYTRATAAGLALHVLALVLLVPRLGATGAALALVLADLAAAALLLPALRRMERVR